MTELDMRVLTERIRHHLTELRLAGSPGQQCYHYRCISSTAKSLVEGADTEASKLYEEELCRREAEQNDRLG